jgi:hypothetical protein
MKVLHSIHTVILLLLPQTEREIMKYTLRTSGENF